MSYLAYFDSQNMVLYVRFPFMPNGDKVVADFKAGIPGNQRSYNERLGRSWSFAFLYRGTAMRILESRGYKVAVVSNGNGKPDARWCQANPNGNEGPGKPELGNDLSWWRTAKGGDRDKESAKKEDYPHTDIAGRRYRWVNDPARENTYRRKAYSDGSYGQWEWITAEDFRNGAGGPNPFEGAKRPEDFEDLFEHIFGKRSGGSGGSSYSRQQNGYQDQSSGRQSSGGYSSGRSGSSGSTATASRSKTSHDILCVTADAPKEVITAAYKALARLYHPDLGGSDAKMKELNSAYDRIKG